VRGHRDLRLLCAAAVLCALIAALLRWEAVRLLVALPLAVFLPGYAIVAAAFAGQRLDPQRLLTMTLACGLSVLCLGGIVLNFLPGGLRTVTWALLLVLVVVAAARTAAVRRPQPTTAGPRGARPRFRRIDLACGGLALAVAAAALVIAYTPLPSGNAAGYTALWMLPAPGASGSAVKVGVVSAEQHVQRYRLVVHAGKQGAAKTSELTLEPGDERVTRVQVALEATGPTRVVASLYKQARPDALYRRVTTWLRPGGEGG
jgi:uncharacterized membrane protein